MTDPFDLEVDIVVAGAGLVGATAALALGRCGHSVALVDRRRPAVVRGALGFDVRTVALNAASAELLANLGIWETLTVCDYRRVVVWEDTGSGRIEFHADEAGVDRLGAVTEVGPAAERLWQAAMDEPRVSCIEGLLTAVEPIGGPVGEPYSAPAGAASRGAASRGAASRGAASRGAAARVAVTLADRRIGARLLVAADGADSSVCKLLGVPVRRTTTAHRAIATVAETAAPHAGTAWQRFLRDGPLALLPLPDRGARHSRHYCAVVWSQSPAEAERRMTLADAAFAHELQAASEAQLGAIRAVDRRFCFTVDQQLAANFHCAPGVVLIGDAAHVLHPLAGQGVNLGLEDVRELVAIARGLAPADLAGAQVWQSFARRRRLRARLMLRAMDAFRAAYALDDPWLHWLRNQAVGVLDRAPRIKAGLIDEALGTGLIGRSL